MPSSVKYIPQIAGNQVTEAPKYRKFSGGVHQTPLQTSASLNQKIIVRNNFFMSPIRPCLMYNLSNKFVFEIIKSKVQSVRSRCFKIMISDCPVLCFAMEYSISKLRKELFTYGWSGCHSNSSLYLRNFHFLEDRFWVNY